MSRVTIAAEIGMAHDGDPSRVAAYAAAAKACGVDVLKLQCHLPEESSEYEQWRVPPANGESRLAYWTRTAWDVETWRKVGQTIHEHGLKFGCSVFSLEAVELLRQVPELDVWKIPSSIMGWELVDTVFATAEQSNKPVWKSYGMGWPSPGRRFWVKLVCTSFYPSTPRDVTLKEVTGRHGWSDHTRNAALIHAAVGRGAKVVEVHFDINTPSGPDAFVTWTPETLAELIRGIRDIETSLYYCRDRFELLASDTMQEMRKLYMPTRLNGRIAKHNGLGEPL
jgi:sialic acid synthase SpsE